MATSTPTATDFKRGDLVRYIGDNAHHGMVGTVRGLDTWIPGEVKVDVDFHAAPGGRKIRKIVAPENLEKLESTRGQR
jgi:hypothetical protein